MPNSKKDNKAKELFNDYLIMYKDELIFKTKKLNKVIKFINNFNTVLTTN